MDLMIGEMIFEVWGFDLNDGGGGGRGVSNVGGVGWMDGRWGGW